jgi:CTP synthase
MSPKFIFVTGGVVSGVGKGVTAASIGALLKARGLRVQNQKLDPYINVDSGLMSPVSHGEIFVTEDGAETDIDIGHYERFTDIDLDHRNSISAGRIYWSLIRKERHGGFMGTTVQVVPHVVNEIREFVFRSMGTDEFDIVITEVGGTVGDMESLPYLESIRQMSFELGRENVAFVHVTLIPYLRMAGEIKTKPTQHSVHTLLSLGIQPDILVCRTEAPFDSAVKSKIALYCNVEPESVVQNLDQDSLYDVPLALEAEGLGRAVCARLGIAQIVEPDLEAWQSLAERRRGAVRTVRIGLVGKYTNLYDAYLSVDEALEHAATRLGFKVDLVRIAAEDLERLPSSSLLDDIDGILVPGGFGPRGMEGMIAAARYARENLVPFFGIGLGMQMAVVEVARNLAGISDAHSTESEAPCTPIFTLPDAPSRPEGEKPMRRGAWTTCVTEGTRLYAAYGRTEVSERHHHRWELAEEHRESLASNGLLLSGPSGFYGLVDAVELERHPWFIGTIFHPEFRSRPFRPHPLFLDFVRAASERTRSPGSDRRRQVD